MAGILGPDPPPGRPAIKCGIDQDNDCYIEVTDAEGMHRYYFDPETMMAFAQTMKEAAFTAQKRKNAVALAPIHTEPDPLAGSTEFPAPPFPIN